ncbi:hypothetical protein EIP86_006049 [Pleurotus ostreatoroseus]|nr:hypothetical protein EIP86_006049 [Pleurotus ostreatoroseus]
MGGNAQVLLILLCIFALCISGNGVYAFGAGNIPGFAYMEGRAFRHGDIEDTLATLAKTAGGGFALSSLIGKGSKFGGLDIKRVYFGKADNDESQTIINLVMVLGFMANGYATHEFEVTEERLGTYLPTEHIDNPKGYPDDARNYHPKLRPPVDPQELEIDLRTGMKNYIANENGHWDTSKALVRRTLEHCIHLGRQHRANNQKQDLYEAYRLLGQALHTLEDFAAHSNFCELALANMGHTEVFVHVGDQVRIQAPNGKWVAPIVTGTFGSQDFIHSLLGEATDHISQASVTDLNAELEKARAKAGATRGGGNGAADTLRDLLFKLPGSGGSEMAREMDSIERIRAGPAQGGKPPDQLSPQELHAVLWQVLTFRDSVAKKIEKTIEKIPGLGPLIEKIMDSVSVFVFTTLEPFLKPLMKTATTQLMAASGQVINSQDQYEVFNDPRASDPTHSFLSKDHFNLILNEPAGNLGKIVLTHAVTLIVKAWDDASMNVHQVTEDILSSLFHPDFHDSRSKVQRDMLDYMRKWVQELGGRQREVIQRLTKESVRNHKNIRLKGEGGAPAAQGTYAQNLGTQTQHDLQGYVSSIPVVGSAAGMISSMGGSSGHGGQGHGGGGLMGNISNMGNMGSMMGKLGEAQSFLGQFSQSSGPRRDVSSGYQYGGVPPGGESFPSAPPPSNAPYSSSPTGEYPSAAPQPSFPGGPSHSSYSENNTHSSYPGAPSPGFPGGSAPQSSYPPPPGPPSGFPPAPPEPSSMGGYAPSYGSSSYGPPEPNPGFPSYGGSSYPPPPGPPGGAGFPSAPGDASSFPNADPYGAPPAFPGGPGGHEHRHGHGHGYGGPPPNGPFGW